jgi:hypothetical protein
MGNIYTPKWLYETLLKQTGCTLMCKDYEEAAQILVKKGLAEVEDGLIRINYFTGPQTYQNACLKARGELLK